MALLPVLFVVGTSIACSLAYKYTPRLHLSRTQRSRIVTFHAFAIECFQLFLAVAAIGNSYDAIRSSSPFLRAPQTPGMKRFVSDSIAVASILLMHICAILAIEVTDNFVQLGTCVHPFQYQAFLLTRSVLLPHTVKTRASVRMKLSIEIVDTPRGRSRTKKTVVASMPARRASSQPATALRLEEMGVQFPSETRNALAQANPFGKPRDRVTFRARTTSAHKQVPIYKAETAEMRRSKAEISPPKAQIGMEQGSQDKTYVSAMPANGDLLAMPLTPQSMVKERWTAEHSSGAGPTSPSMKLRPRPRASSTKQSAMGRGMTCDEGGSPLGNTGRARGSSVKERVKFLEQSL
ncbi:hypothetical protein BST61_g7288 [Cercospora zeina]